MKTQLLFVLLLLGGLARGHAQAEGSVVAWGANGWGSIDFGVTNVPAGLTNVIAVAAGAVHSLALKSDGSVVTWGGRNYAADTNVPVSPRELIFPANAPEPPRRFDADCAQKGIDTRGAGVFSGLVPITKFCR